MEIAFLESKQDTEWKKTSERNIRSYWLTCEHKSRWSTSAKMTAFWSARVRIAPVPASTHVLCWLQLVAAGT